MEAHYEISDHFLARPVEFLKALEIQFLEIMRGATKIADALEVQRQIAEVRTDIEQLEGRKRFLENRSSLSTINVNIRVPKPVIAVTQTGFRHSLREAISDSVRMASGAGVGGAGCGVIY